jgi:hypothetical protein
MKRLQETVSQFRIGQLLQGECGTYIVSGKSSPLNKDVCLAV